MQKAEEEQQINYKAVAVIAVTCKMLILPLYFFVYCKILKMGQNFLRILSKDIKISEVKAEAMMYWIMFYFIVVTTRDDIYGSYVYIKFAFLTKEADQQSFACNQYIAATSGVIGYFKQCQYFV